MTPSAKAGLVLLATFALGATVGYLGHATQVQARRGPPPRGEGPPPGRGPREKGFVAHMEGLIQPRDQRQRDALRPHLNATDSANRTAVDQARALLRANTDTLRSRIAPLLDDDQRARLDRFSSRPMRGAPPGLGGPPRP